MASTLTPNYKWVQPTVGGDPTTWGNEINNDLALIDAQVFNNEQGVVALQGLLKPSSLVLTTTSPNNATISFNKSPASPRWIIYDDGSAETGGNAGSNLAVNAYSDTGAYLSTPLSFIRATGNATFAAALTVSGLFTANAGLNVNGSINASGNINSTLNMGSTNNLTAGAGVYVAYPTVTDFVLYRDGSNDRILQWAGNWYDIWYAANGIRAWVGGSGPIQLMTLDGAGNLATHGNINTGALNSASVGTGPITASTINASGLITTSANISANGGISSNSNIYAAGAYGGPDNGGGVIQGYSGHGFSFNWGAPYAYIRIDGDQLQLATNPPCDERIKQNIRPSPVDALGILNAVPIDEFEIKAEVVGWMSRREAGPEHVPIGIVAQKLQALIPEAISITPQSYGSPLPADLLTLVDAKLTPYLLRAIQQLTERVQLLEAKLAA